MTLLEQINKLVPEPLKAQIKELKAKFDATSTPVATVIPVVAPTNLSAIETKLKDGTTLSVDKMEVGGKAQLISEAGVVDAPDADYEAEDGTVITVSSGLVSAIKKVEAPAASAPDNGMPAMMAALTARLDAIETKFTASQNENSTLKTQLEALTSANKVTLSAVNIILSAPAGDPVIDKNKKTARKEKAYEDMTKHEQLLFNKGKL